MVLCLIYPGTPLKTIAGNPSIYVALFTGLGLRYRWPAAFVLLKPSMFPLAVIGWRDWRTYAVAALILGASLPLAATWQWPRTVLDANGGGLLYSAWDLPMVLIPVIAWVASSSRARGGSSTEP